MIKLILFISGIIFLCITSLGQVNTMIRNNTLDFLMSTTTLGVEHRIGKKTSLQLNLGYTYAERFGIYNATDLRGGVIDAQIRNYLSKDESILSGFYIGFSTVYRFASYTTENSYYLDGNFIHERNIKASAGYVSLGCIGGYQWELVKGKLFWDNYIGICARIGNGYKRNRNYYMDTGFALTELTYTGIAPKFATALCLAIR